MARSGLIFVRVWCITEGRFVTTTIREGEALPTVCPLDAGAIDSNLTTITFEEPIDQEITLTYGIKNQVQAPVFLNAPGDVPALNTPYTLLWDATLVSVEVHNELSSSFVFTVAKDDGNLAAGGEVIHAITASNEVFITSSNIFTDMSEGDRIAPRLASVNNPKPKNVVATITIRRT